MPALARAGLISAPSLESFRDAGFFFDHAIRDQLPLNVVAKERRLAARYASERAAGAEHVASMVPEFPRVWAMGGIARNAITVRCDLPRVKRSLQPPYMYPDSRPRFFFSQYLRPRFDTEETVNGIVEAFRVFLGRGGDSADDQRSVEQLVRQRREEILRIAAKHGAHNVRLFGSVARREADELSDIDFLVDLEPGRTLLDLGGLLTELREFLGCEVDVATERSLKTRIRDRVLQEAVPL